MCVFAMKRGLRGTVLRGNSDYIYCRFYLFRVHRVIAVDFVVVSSSASDFNNDNRIWF